MSADNPDRVQLLPGQQIVLVAHSGGGAVVPSLAGKLETGLGVDVAGIVTLGSPLSDYDEGLTYTDRVLNFYHQDDIWGQPYLRGGKFMQERGGIDLPLTSPASNPHNSYMDWAEGVSKEMMQHMSRHFPEMNLNVPSKTAWWTQCAAQPL